MVARLVAGDEADVRLEHVQLPSRIAYGGELGGQLAEDEIVLVIRGELLKRYPKSTLAKPAKTKADFVKKNAKNKSVCQG